MVFCKNIWQVVGDDDGLYDSFRNADIVISVLEQLSAVEAIVINALVKNKFVIKKGSLFDVVPSVDLVLHNLKKKSLIYMMKNRARLNESLDTIYLNEIVKSTIIDNSIISDNELHCSDYISLNEDLNPDYNTYSDYLNSRISMKAAQLIPRDIKYRLNPFELFFLKDGFKRVGSLSEEKQEKQTIFGIRKFDFLYILNIFLYHVRKKEVKLDESNNIRKRDWGYFCRVYSIDEELLFLIFEWALKNSLIELDERVIKINELGFSILSSDFKGKSGIIREIIKNYDLPASLDLLDFYKFLNLQSEILVISDYRLIMKDIQKMAKEVKMLYGFGLIDVYFNKKNRVEKISFSELDKNEGTNFLILSPTMDILVYMDRISPQDLFVLRCFSELEIKDNIATGKVSENSVIRAIMTGMSGASFIALLYKGSEKEIAQNVIFILEDWINSFSDVSLQERFILNGDKQVIELLMHDNKLKQYVDVVLNENYLILKNVDKRVIVDLLENEKVKIGYDKK